MHIKLSLSRQLKTLGQSQSTPTLKDYILSQDEIDDYTYAPVGHLLGISIPRCLDIYFRTKGKSTIDPQDSSLIYEIKGLILG